MNQAASNGHPSWQEILSVLPTELHPLITPKLQEWDAGVTKKLEEVHNQYAPMKEFIDNQVDPEIIKEALGLVNMINTDPSKVAADLNEHFNLGYVDKEEAEKLRLAQQTSADPVNDPYGDPEFKIEDHPQFKAMQAALESVQSRIAEDDKTREQREADEATERELNELREKHGQIDDIYVMALMANGMSGEQAVNHYQTAVNQAAAELANANNTNTVAVGQSTAEASPVVLGADGTSGSGTPNEAFDVGASTSDEAVKKFIAQQMEANKAGQG